MKKIITILVCMTLIINLRVFAAGEETLLAKSAVIIDGENGRILYGKNPEQKMAMASTTKIMTCMIALEKCDMNQVMTVSDNAARMPKVRMNIKKDEQYYLKDLLYAMMLESYNDVAVVVAENMAGSVEAFAKMMNQKAKEIGAKNTNFVTPNGLDAKEHYSTAYDMALIGAYAIKNRMFAEIVRCQSYTFREIKSKRTITANNKDAFLLMERDALGIKTGFTGNAGYCFVGAVKNNGRTFVSCVLACGWPPNKSYKWHDTKMLMNLAKDNYEHKTLLQREKQIGITIENGTQKQIRAMVAGESRMLISNQDLVEVKTEFDYKLPIHKKDIIGKVEIWVNRQCLEEHDIVALESVRRYDYPYCLEKTLDSFILQ